MEYVPSPIDTDAVVLAPELDRLAERLAEHVHDLWAEARLAEGGRTGLRARPIGVFAASKNRWLLLDTGSNPERCPVSLFWPVWTIEGPLAA